MIRTAFCLALAALMTVGSFAGTTAALAMNPAPVTTIA